MTYKFNFNLKDRNHVYPAKKDNYSIMYSLTVSKS